MKKGFQIFLILLVICQLGLLLVTIIDNNILINYFLSDIKGAKSLDALNGLTSASIVIFDTNLIFVQVLLSLFIAFFIWCIFKIDLVFRYLSSFCAYLFIGFKTVFGELKNRYVLILLLIPLLSSIYFGFTMPVSYDEALTYVEFTHNPITYCISSYPLPNNHIFHSILTHISTSIPFLDLLFKLRIPSIVVSFLTWIIAFSFVKRFYSRKIAFFVIAISSMLFMSVYYSYMSRGYALVTLFFIISLYAAFNIMKFGSRNRDWAIFSISSVLGFYAVPSFLYPFLTLNLFIFIYNYKNIKQQFIFNLFIALFTLLLYSPIILHQGFEALTSPAKDRLWVLSYMPIFFKDTFSEIFGLPIFVTFIIIFVALFFAFREREKMTLLLWLVFGLSPVILLIGHSVIPFPRTFVYYGFFIIFLIGISFSKYIEKISVKLLVGGLFIIQSILCLNFGLNINGYETFNIYYKDMTDKVMDIEKENKGYVLSGLYLDTHKFEMISRGYNPDVVKYDRLFISFDDIKQVNIDTISSEYNYIIIDKDKDVTVYKKPSYSNEYLNLYK